MQNVAILRCFSLIFCEQRRRNEQTIKTHAYAAMYSLPLPLNFALLNSLKSNKGPNNEQPDEHETNEFPGEQKDG